MVDRFQDGLIAARGVSKGFELAIPLEGLLDLDAERARLEKELAKAEKDLGVSENRLHNPSFTERAPAEVVEKERRLSSELREKVLRFRGSLKNLEGGGEP
jgi:valyl-tRNA synthetase